MTFLFLKAFHIIAMVAWFAALFYLPRLFVYHADAKDLISINRFKLMEFRLYYFIGWPAAIFTTILGVGLLLQNFSYYFSAHWMHMKLLLVIFLWVYHIYCGIIIKHLKNDTNTKSSVFFRVFNEIPTVILILIVLLVIVKPF